MISKKSVIFILAFLSTDYLMYAGSIDFYTKDNDLYIVNKEEQHIYRIKDISSRSALTIHVPAKKKEGKENKSPEKDQAEQESKETKPLKKNSEENLVKDRVLLNKYILESRDFYQSGQLKQAWDVLDLAEEIDSQDHRIKTMKGSLLIEMGDTKLGLEYWKESLKINPQQVELREKIKSLEKDKK